MVAEKAIQTFSAFEGKVMGNTVKGISLIQEGPALGHGVWVDSTTLSQVKRAATGMGRVKAKLNHWSGIQDTVGYYENFRIRGGKLLADLTLFESHDGKGALLEMIETIPGAFGVSIMFRGDEPEYDKDNDRYNTRVRELYSADFVDTPAANRDGVFEAGVDKPKEDMPKDDPKQQDTAAEAFDAKAAIAALEAKIAEQAAQIAAFQAVKQPEQKQVVADKPDTDALSAKIDELSAVIKAFAIAPKTEQQPAPPSEQEKGSEDPNLKTREQFEALDHDARRAFIAGGGKLK